MIVLLNADKMGEKHNTRRTTGFSSFLVVVSITFNSQKYIDYVISTFILLFVQCILGLVLCCSGKKRYLRTF